MKTVFQNIDFLKGSGLSTRQSMDALGFIPLWLDPEDPRPAADQLNENYLHGGGWQPFDGFTLRTDDNALTYPGDPDQMPFARIDFRAEKVFMYRFGWVMILQPDGSFEVCRMD